MDDVALALPESNAQSICQAACAAAPHDDQTSEDADAAYTVGIQHLSKAVV